MDPNHAMAGRVVRKERLSAWPVLTFVFIAFFGVLRLARRRRLKSSTIRHHNSNPFLEIGPIWRGVAKAPR